MERIVVTSYARTPISSQNGHEFIQMGIPELAVIPVKAAVERSNLGKSDVDTLIMGQMGSASGEATNLARHVALKAGLDHNAGMGYTVNRVCGSGFQAAASAMMEIWTGQGDVYVAAGCEMNSHRLVSLPLSFAWTGIPKGGIKLGGSSGVDVCTPPELYGEIYGPAYTVEKAARIYGISREDSDLFAYQSQMKMKKAQETGRFDNEIIPIEAPQTDKKGKVTMVRYDKDLHPKPYTTPEGLAGLRPAFEQDGVITAGNASGSCDGAAAIVIMSETEAKKRDLKPVAYLNAFAFAGVDPTLMGTGPVPAVGKLFKNTGLSFDDIDVFELHEAFATQSLTCLKLFDKYIGSAFYEKVNPNGGAVSIGHPEGCTGVRLLMTLSEELHRTGKRYGLTAACIGGGMGVSFLLENAQL